jgi:hypothetical protein
VFTTAGGQPAVAQTSSLLYRGFPIRRATISVADCRLEAGDTAGWKPIVFGSKDAAHVIDSALE